jgi:hypothetical protein
MHVLGTQSMRRHLTVKSSPGANVRHTLVLLESLRLVVQHEGARQAVAYARWYCGSNYHTLAHLLDATQPGGSC